MNIIYIINNNILLYYNNRLDRESYGEPGSAGRGLAGSAYSHRGRDNFIERKREKKNARKRCKNL